MGSWCKQWGCHWNLARPFNDNDLNVHSADIQGDDLLNNQNEEVQEYVLRRRLFYCKRKGCMIDSCWISKITAMNLAMRSSLLVCKLIHFEHSTHRIHQVSCLIMLEHSARTWFSWRRTAFAILCDHQNLFLWQYFWPYREEHYFFWW